MAKIKPITVTVSKGLNSSVPKKDMTEMVESIREQSCCYLEDPCDCKYGRGKWTDLNTGGEQTSCPELRELVHLLSVMTDDEYQMLMGRPQMVVAKSKKKGAVRANSKPKPSGTLVPKMPRLTSSVDLDKILKKRKS